MDSVTYFLADENATLEWGRQLARATFTGPGQGGSGHPCSGAIIYLSGDLGAGKTTLSRGILRGFDYAGAVKSPTYTLVEPYEFDQCHIYHFDLYRLADPEEVEYLGTEDYFQSSNLCIVEWPEKGEGSIPPPDLAITLSEADSGRQLDCQACSEKGRTIVKRMSTPGRNL